jgi:precorrin-3B synthase
MSAQRRGACPGLSAPMPTGDGLLVRLMPAEPIPAATFAGFCEAARQHGNGTIEITQRGSLQVRGLTPRSAPLFAAAIADLEIDAPAGVPVITDPLFAEDALDIAGVAPALRQALRDAQLVLSAKVSVVIDGGERLHLDALAADVRLRAVMHAGEHRFHVGLGGDAATATWLGSVAQADAAAVVLRVLSVVAADGPQVRAVDILRARGIAAFRSAVGSRIAPAPPPRSRTPAEMVGVHRLRDGTVAVGIGLPFGHTRAATLAHITRIAADQGARRLRPTPDRALLVIGIAARDAPDLQRSAEQLGFVIRPDDLRRRVVACPGAPACASGMIAARELAAAMTPALAGRLQAARGVALHISGCPKGCAHPAPAALTVVGTAQGCGIVRNNCASAPPDVLVDRADLVTAIGRLAAQTCEVAHG